jgi:D-alanine-D-alanine ligase
MRVLILHSDVAPEAPADEQDTLITAHAIASALEQAGHPASLAAFKPDLEDTRALLHGHRADAVFNMVEAIFGLGELAPMVPSILEKLTVPFTGCGAAAMALAGDKVLAKRILRLAGLPTPDWHEFPFADAAGDRLYVVKSVTEDASLGLDPGAVVAGRQTACDRAKHCRHRHGGRWFAEAYVDGREFNISVIEENGEPRVLPIPEMTFENWDSTRPRIVDYGAKWIESSAEFTGTVRRFGGERAEPVLHRKLAELAERAWRLFGLRGFARVDFRVDASGAPTILEINPNPGLEPDAGFAAAAAEANISYPELAERLLAEALRQRES